MDANIQTTTPSGSPILAYGEVCPPRFGAPRRWIAGVFGVLILLVSIVLVGSFLEIPFPKQTAVLVGLHSGSSLTDPLPRLVQHTAETTKFPFVAGLVLQNGEWKPFTITIRGFGNAGSWSQAAGMFVIHADAPLDLESVSTRKVLGPIIRLGRHSASVSVDGGAIDPSFSGVLSGVVDGSTFQTDERVASHAHATLGTGDITANLDALPGSWPLIRESLIDSGITLDEMPSTIAWTETTGTLPELDLAYHLGPSTSTILALAAAAGQYDTELLTLADGSTMEDLRLPTHLLTATSTLRWEVSSGTVVSIDGHEAHIRTGALRPSLTPGCQGDLLAQFSAHALEGVAQRLNIIGEQLRSLSLVDSDGKLAICWH